MMQKGIRKKCKKLNTNDLDCKQSTGSKKWCVQDWLMLLILTVLTLLTVAIFVPGGSLFGSMTDWLNQHVAFADYFRQSFYETGRFFPDFSFDIGGGQNIYNFSYYGLYSPWLVISYALPWIPMEVYIPIIAVGTVICSVSLCYRWIRLTGYTYGIAFLATSTLMWSVPVLFHAHRHIMFISYLPFLFSALIGIENYIRGTGITKAKIQICLSTFFLILSSYFFSPTAILVLLTYSMFRLMQEGEVQWKKIAKIVLLIGLAVGLAGFFLIPTAMALLQGREIGAERSLVSILRLFMPEISPDWVVGSPYGLGLTPFVFFALILGWIDRQKPMRFLSILLTLILLIPGLIWILNGTLYVKPKILIPFLPLYILLIAQALWRMKQYLFKWVRQTSRKSFVFMGIFSAVFLYLAFVMCMLGHTGEEWVSKEQWRTIGKSEKSEMVQSISAEDSNFYRLGDLTENTFTANQTYGGANRASVYSSISHAGYNQAYFSLMGNPVSARNRSIMATSPNIFSQVFMGEKYLLAATDMLVPAGFHPFFQKGDWTVYQNLNVQALGYVMENQMSRTEFDKLSKKDQLVTVFQSVVLEDAKEISASDSKVLTKNWWTAVPKAERMQFEKQLKQRIGQAKKGELHTQISIDKKYQNQVLFLQFQVSNEKTKPTQDILIEINGIKNKLSKKTAPYPNENHIFTYILSSEVDWTDLQIELSEGIYEISNVQMAYMEPQQLFQTVAKAVRWEIEGNPKLVNAYKGKIAASADGYFVTTIPYDKGFHIFIDGQPQNYEKVNTAFVGFPMTKGVHEVMIQYTPPGQNLGMILSIGTLVFMIGCFVFRRKVKVLFRVKLWEKYKSAIREVFFYLVFGVLTTIVSFATFQICMDRLHITWQLANIISWICAVVFAYETNRKWVFHSKSRNRFKEFIRFAYYRVASLLIETVALFVLIEFLTVTALIAKLIAAVMVVVANYIFSRLFVFRKLKKYEGRKSVGEK